jgi:hypothetical protein
MGKNRATWAASAVGLAALTLAAWAGVAAAVSGGGFNPDQQDCPWNADAWNTPANSVPAGCHNFAVNVETGGTTNGDPNSDNTRFAELGLDQLPNNTGNPAFGQEEYVGDPGTADSPHSGCAAANTDGTGGGTGTGCGRNPAGTGFEANWDYYAVYCPAAALLPFASTPDPTDGQLPELWQCSPNQPVGTNAVTPYDGSANALDQVLTQGLVVYVGAFDNLDNGEHDGFSGLDDTGGAINGPSDGGAVVLSIEPQWLLAPGAPTATHPEGLANASEGECADSICAEATTQQQTVYYGCASPSSTTATWTNNGVDGATNPQNDPADDQCASGTPESTNVYQNNTPASTQEANACSSGGPATTETACFTNQDGTPNPSGADGYRQHTPEQVNAEPGVQTYQDPDPQRSPALPFATPGLYAGTCGVYVNDGGGDGLPGLSSMLTNATVSLDPGYLGPSAC